MARHYRLRYTAALSTNYLSSLRPHDKRRDGAKTRTTLTPRQQPTIVQSNGMQSITLNYKQPHQILLSTSYSCEAVSDIYKTLNMHLVVALLDTRSLEGSETLLDGNGRDEFRTWSEPPVFEVNLLFNGR